MEEMPRILVVEDESAIAELLCLNLRHAGFEVAVATDATHAQRMVDVMLPNLAILDWTLPGQSGIALARQWRVAPRTQGLPLIMLTGRSDSSDVVAALESGIDDYLLKPFSSRELLARIKALLRRRAPELLDSEVTVGPLTLNPVTRYVHAHGIQCRLQPTELKLLHYLMVHPFKIHERKALLDRLWGDHVFIEERTVDVHVKRLRISLAAIRCEAMVQTVRGSGYRMAEPETSLAA